MATSKCPKCEALSFELKEVLPKGSAVKMYFIQCASCGTVVGVTDYHDTASLLEKIAARLNLRLFAG